MDVSRPRSRAQEEAPPGSVRRDCGHPGRRSSRWGSRGWSRRRRGSIATRSTSTRCSAARWCGRCAAPARWFRSRSAGSRPPPTGPSSGSSSRPGALVGPDTVILELSNPELEQSTLEARLNLEAAEARYSNRQVEVERELLNQRATLATTEAQLKDGPPAGRRRRSALHPGPRLVAPAPAIAVGRAGVRYALRARAGTAANGRRHRRGAARGRAGRGGPPAHAVRAAATADGRPARAGRDARRSAAGAARRRAAHHHRRPTWPGWATRRC